MDGNEGRAGEVADSAGAEGGVLQGDPAFGEQRQATFIEPAQGS
ncbi:hypothetical protein ACFFHJ_17015 [Planotetraspora thailandica]|nr:hypothetical protein [Planotetraspora thailandica]